MPSSGKTTLGKQLASKLGFTFVDMDELIVTKEGKTIAKIFEENGEDYFRKIETEVLRSFNEKRNLIISTGGGAPVFFENMDFILENGISVYFDVPPQILFSRIYNSNKNDRPLIDKSDSEKLMENLVEKYNSRYPFYSRANILIKDDYSVGHIVKELEKLH